MILITGCSGFIGFHVTKNLLLKKEKVYGIDNLNNYYDPKIKLDRNKILKKNKNFIFFKIDIINKEKLFKIVKKYKITTIIHLAAQAGVRYSITNPDVYIDSNIKGFLNILEACRFFRIENLICASTSSVYGLNKNFPYKENKIADHPIQLYAATKRSNELMAHSYSCLFNIPITVLRFFTVYGPWGRPDMALFKFTKGILNNKKIEVYNKGKHSRDFTYIDDVVAAVIKLINKPARPNRFWNSKNPDPGSSKYPFTIINVSSGQKIKLIKFINEIEENLKKKAKIKYLPMQKGDIEQTLSCRKKISNYLSLKKPISYKKGIKKFIDWYLEYYNQK
jgi:UDP-glucuronate 4-epimerase